MFLDFPDGTEAPVTVSAHNGALMWALSAATIVMGIYWAPVVAFTNRSLHFLIG